MSKAAQVVSRIFTRRMELPWGLALVPLVTFGWFALVPFVYLSRRRREPRFRLLGPAYVVAQIGAWAISVSPDTHDWNVASAAVMIPFMVGTTVHAFVVRAQAGPRIDDATGRHAVRPTLRTVPTDPTVELVSRLQELLRLLRIWATTSDDLTPVGRRLLAETCVPLGSVLDHAAVGGHADAELRGVDAILTDYLPTSLTAYDRLPREFARTHRNPDGRTATEELEVQLRLIRDRAGELAASLHGADALRMQEQTVFLQGKFGRSELDLH